MIPLSSLLKYESRVLAIGYYDEAHQWVSVFEKSRPVDTKIDSRDGILYMVRYRKDQYGPTMECTLDYFLKHGLPF